VVSEPQDTRRARPTKTCPTCGQRPARPKKPRADTTDADYEAVMLRMVNAYTTRAEAGGIVPLASAVRIRDALDATIDAMVETCRSPAWSASWSEIAEAVGLSRPAAAQRWARFESPRRAGGQPSNLR
jgi:hypothetical protein